MSQYQGEINEAIEQLATKNHCKKEDLEYVVINRDNGFAVITAKAFSKLSKHQINKFLNTN